MKKLDHETILIIIISIILLVILVWGVFYLRGLYVY